MRILKWIFIAAALVCLGPPALFVAALVVNYHRDVPSIEVPIAGTDAVVVLHRQPAHLFLAEYDRQLGVTVGGTEIARTEIWPDTGGERTMDVYRVDRARVALVDRISSFVVDLSDGSVSREDHPPRNGEFLGSLIMWSGETTKPYRFVSNTENPRPLIEPAKLGSAS